MDIKKLTKQAIDGMYHYISDVCNNVRLIIHNNLISRFSRKKAVASHFNNAEMVLLRSMVKKR